MHLSVTTWNINSVRLRLDQVGRYLEKAKPDLLWRMTPEQPSATRQALTRNSRRTRQRPVEGAHQ